MKIPFEIMKSRFQEILQHMGFPEDKAEQCAIIFTENSRDGIYTHGLNRFPTFIEMIKQGLVNSYAGPVLENTIGSLEQWNGNLAPGMLNARFGMDRAISLAKANGIGCVAIRNTNHWMRGGTYGWQAADAGCIGICFTNTIANVPPWGGIDPRLGNNPLVIAVPREGGHIVLDMAMSQYSFGKLLQYQTNQEELPLPGGYDKNGVLSTDATAIIDSKRMLPIGFWKGSGLSLILDLLVTVLSQGKSTKDITDSQKESGVSQVFISIKPNDSQATAHLIEQIIDYTKSSRPENEDKPISYPGENTLKTRIRNSAEGIPVDPAIWNQVLSM